MQGTLTVTVVEARKLKNKDGLFGKNDAYVNLEVAKKKEKTNVIKNAGSKAFWDQTFTFPVPDDKAFLHIEVMDYDKISFNDLIGMVNVPLTSIKQFGMIECWYPLINNGDYSGEINLFIRFSRS
ncbi:hypothetical protein K502DRAFT_27260 [Neoconidiobolus thromboides FSU 785]|nr:hypothetical protein K502DRAFT_27260 [Neoconidiobolus thromboides FSU 785]